MKDKTAKEQIESKFKNLQKEIRKAVKNGEFEDALNDVLGVSKTLTTRLTLSWGGPADYIELDQDENGDVVAGRYIYAEWYDVAEKELTEEELAEIASFYGVYLEENI